MFEPIKEDGQAQSSEPPERPCSGARKENVYINAERASSRIDLQPFEQFASCLLHASCESGAELSVSLVTDTAIQELNRDFRGTDRPTDVLSFSMREGELIGQDYPLGDIVISIETAQRQAGNFGNNLTGEIQELLFHGFLHLLGYDHEGDKRMKWDEMEARLINELKRFNSPYSPKGLNPEENHN